MASTGAGDRGGAAARKGLAAVWWTLAVLGVGVGMGVGWGCEERAAKPAWSGPRIAVLSPALAATLKDLGYERWVVGRHGWDLSLDPSVPVVGDTVGGGIDYEALVGVSPTHVVVQLGLSVMPERLEALADRHAWVVMRHEALTLDEIMSAAEALDEALRPLAWPEGTEAERRGTPIAGLRARLARAYTPRAGLERLGPVLMLAQTEPAAALGPGSCHHEVLVRLGATPALVRGGPYVEVQAEDVLSMRPGVIVLVMPRARGVGLASGATGSGALVARLGVLGRLDIPAVRAGRVVLIDDPRALLPGTPMIEFAERLGAALSALAWEGDEDEGR
ncbi:MAG: hypothetical protein HRU70_00750 [Phycisphaeraceae bacterium]|nr:MAG: hypothetical protein HRU70_00750 [Phycisphaeraceae bacterium]